MPLLLRSPLLLTTVFVVLFVILTRGGPATLALPVLAPILYFALTLLNWIMKRA